MVIVAYPFGQVSNGIAPFLWFLLTSRGSGCQNNATLQESEACLSVALALDELEPVDLASGLAAAPGLRQSRPDGRGVRVQSQRERRDGRSGAIPGDECDAGVSFEPAGPRGCGPIGEEVNHAMAVEVDHGRAVSAAHPRLLPVAAMDEEPALGAAWINHEGEAAAVGVPAQLGGSDDRSRH